VLGYWRDEDRTAGAFRSGWFHSGDLGVFTADGYLSVVDRKKDMGKSGAENVASRQVEEAIYLLDGVAEVAVFGIPHPHWVEAVVAAVVPRAGSQLTADAVAEHCPGAAGRLQAAEVRHVDLEPAEEPERQAAQAGIARELRPPVGGRLS